MGKRTVTDKVSLVAGHMKNLVRLCVIALVSSVFVVSISFSGSATKGTINTVPDFERMKSPVGEWQGKSLDGNAARVSYTLVSDNSALMEKLVMGGEGEMVTMYHPDGDHLMMTHYCSAHNQPRMRTQTTSGEGRDIVFDLMDVTNLSAPDAGHMKKLVVTFEDKDHFSQEWTWTEKGKDGTVVIHFERQK